MSGTLSSMDTTIEQILRTLLGPHVPDNVITELRNEGALAAIAQAMAAHVVAKEVTGVDNLSVNEV